MTLRAASQMVLSVADVRADPNCGCITPTTPSDATITEYIEMASDVIAIVTGMRVAGRQTLIARPYRGCDYEIDEYYGHGDRYLQQNYCACCGLDVIPLGDEQPVISEIKIDGVVLAPQYYWLHWNRVSWVVARRPLPNETIPRHWPSRQRRYLPDTEQHTFAIRFTRGIHLDSTLIKDAALEIVCDLASDEYHLANEIEGAVSADMGGVRVELESELLHRIRSGDMGPRTRRMMGVYAPDARQYSMVWAPELMMGWELGLEVVP